MQRDGKNLEAQKRFEGATKEDPNFALAFSRLAQTYSILGYDDEAEQAAKKAVTLSQDLPQTEKYLIAAVQAQISKHFPEAIKAYENLAKASPDNGDVQSALANLYEQAGGVTKASEYNQKILAANPNDITATLAMGRLAINSDKPQAALDPLNRALTLAIQFDNQERKAASLSLIRHRGPEDEQARRGATQLSERTARSDVRWPVRSDSCVAPRRACSSSGKRCR